jgi:hypothetical protein
MKRWVTFRIYQIELSGGNLKCNDDYAARECANDAKLHIFYTKDKAETYSKHLRTAYVAYVASVGSTSG